MMGMTSFQNRAIMILVLFFLRVLNTLFLWMIECLIAFVTNKINGSKLGYR